MTIQLKYIDFEKAVFGPNPADPAIPDRTIYREDTGLDGETFRRAGKKGLEMTKFEANIKAEQFSDPAREFLNTVGPNPVDSGLGFKEGTNILNRPIKDKE